MSDLDKVVALSVTVACTDGPGATDVSDGTHRGYRDAPRTAAARAPLAPDLVLGLALFEFLRFLGLPTRAPFSFRSRSMLSYLIAAEPCPGPQIARGPGLLHPVSRRREGASMAPKIHRPIEPLRVGEYLRP